MSKDTVRARIDFGRWIADCPCGGAAYVDPDDPVFWCGSCGNEAHGGDLLMVEFPGDRETIEAEVLSRPVLERPGLDPTQAAMNAVPLVPGLPRSWLPGENVKELQKQKRRAAKAKGKL